MANLLSCKISKLRSRAIMSSPAPSNFGPMQFGTQLGLIILVVARDRAIDHSWSMFALHACIYICMVIYIQLELSYQCVLGLKKPLNSSANLKPLWDHVPLWLGTHLVPSMILLDQSIICGPRFQLYSSWLLLIVGLAEL